MSRLTDPQDAQEAFENSHNADTCPMCQAIINVGLFGADPAILDKTPEPVLPRHAQPESAFGSESLATNLRESVRRHVEIQENDQIYPIGQVIKAYCEILDIRFQAVFIKAGEDHWHQTGNEDCVTWHDLLDWLSGDHVVAYDLAVDWHSVWSR